MLEMMKTPRRTPTTIPMVVFVLEVVSRLRSSFHLAARWDKLEMTCGIAAGAGAARAEGGGVEEVGGREGSGIYIQCLVLRDLIIYSDSFLETMVCPQGDVEWRRKTTCLINVDKRGNCTRGRMGRT